ncbi:armadillo repeat protein [Histoplasma capsulatum H143]|uniref:Armadillo repeat protein n=1 Tax=Ajellomyces capsulatus (strain H143) TaxID=544712 RepID=C6HQT7_AJECH|nr:armadillo repeat protein [Histoplasma capsulatum H143]
MARAATPQIISDIQNPDSTASRIEALRLLKNDIIGHDQRKEAWIGWGIIPLLSQILAGRRGAGKKTTGGEVNGHTRRQHLARSRSGRSDDDEVCLQAILIIGSLAQGGPPFISPIAAGGIFPLLLSIFSSRDCHPSLFLAVLETLNTIADRFPLYQQQSLLHAKQLSSLLYSRDHVETLRRLLIGSTSSSSQRPVTLAANLIAKTCSEESYKAVLGESGVLDALAFKLSTFVVAQGFVLPGAENNIMDPGALKTLPPAAPPNAQLAPILRAITVIIENSKSRAEHFVSSPAVVAVFPKQIPEFSPNDIKRSPWGAHISRGRRLAQCTIIDASTSVPAAHLKLDFTSRSQPHGRQSNFFSPPLSFSEAPSSDEDESALISWLFTVSDLSRVRLVS